MAAATVHLHHELPQRPPVADARSAVDWAEEQAAFERWYLGTQTRKNAPRVTKFTETGLYVDKVVRIAWRAWRQAVERHGHVGQKYLPKG